MNRRARARRWAGLSATAIVIVGILALGSCATPGTGGPRAGAPVQGRSIAHPASKLQTKSAPVSKSDLAAELLATHSTEQAIHSLENAPGAPACAHPPVPNPTYPPGHSYGVPFLAAITGGQILTAYSEWVADHHVYKVGGKTYDLYPWDVQVFDITGWVTGLIQLPSLSAQIPPQDVVFCDQAGPACLGKNYAAGECIHINQLFPGPGTQGSEITNLHPEDAKCQGYAGKEPGYPYPCVPYRHHAGSERHHHADRNRRRTRRCTRPSNLNRRVYNCQCDHHRYPDLSTTQTDSDRPVDKGLESSRRCSDRADDREPRLPIPPDGTVPPDRPARHRFEHGRKQ